MNYKVKIKNIKKALKLINQYAISSDELIEAKSYLYRLEEAIDDVFNHEYISELIEHAQEYTIAASHYSRVCSFEFDLTEKVLGVLQLHITE